jgi:hypothetical protein
VPLSEFSPSLIGGSDDLHARCASRILRRYGGTPRHYRIRIKFLFQNILERYDSLLVLS